MGETNLCYGCMESKPEEGICPHCGYDPAQDKQPPHALKPGTKLHDRYLVGKVLESNGEGMTYLAYDCNIGCKVKVREYLPLQLCSRVADSTLVKVDYNNLAQYKALMAEYTELNKALARQRSLVHLNPALDLIAENNTTYAVYEYLEGRPLLDYLKENAGELSWRTVSRMFPPLFTTLSILHNAGVLHRGISPETIFVTDKEDLKLGGFCISAVRTNDTELTAELFEGYAAPEQYFANRQQGTWTDVYGICAVLYRILTGSRATDANTRQNYDNLIPPHELNPRVPKNVSDGIMQGLCLDGNARVRTITDLVTMLFESGDGTEEAIAATTATHRSATTTFRTVSTAATAQPSAKTNRPAAQASAEEHISNRTGNAARKAQQRHAPPAEPATVSLMDRIRVPILIAILILVIVGIILIAFQQQFNGGGNHPISENSSMDSAAGNVIPVQTGETTQALKYDSIMPRLVGMNYQVKKNQMAGWLELIAEYEYNDDFSKDEIFEQALEEGVGFMSGDSVVVKVSLGSAKKELPDFKGYKIQAYLGKLEEMGFVTAVEEKSTNKPKPSSTTTETTVVTTNEQGLRQTVIFRSKVDYNYTSGYVCAVEPDIGTKIDLQKDYTIVVYYAQNPEVSSTKKTTPTASSSTTTTTSKTTVDHPGSTNEQTGSSTATSNSPASSVTTPPASSEQPPPSSAPEGADA